MVDETEPRAAFRCLGDYKKNNNAADSNKTMMKSVLYNGAVKEYLEHNYSLENDPKFQKLLPDVMREVYTAYVENQIKGSEDLIKLFSELGGAYDTQEREKRRK